MRGRIKVLSAALAAVFLALGLYLCHALGAWGVERRAPEPDELAPQIAQRFAQLIPRLHLKHQPINAEVATNAVFLYLTALDFDHSYFLAADVEEFMTSALALPQQLRAGDVTLAFTVFARLKERVADRVAFVDRLLSSGFDTTTHETYRWKRKDLPWPATPKEWDELWRRKIKHEYVARLVARRLSPAQTTHTNDQAQSVTGPTGVTTAAVTTGTPARASALDEQLAPDTFLRRRYKQYLTVLEDSDADFVLQRFFTALAQAYDPHSEYMTASSSEDFDISMKLSLVGIGALLGTEDGAARVEQIIPGGPAARDGRLKPGDKIIAVAQGDGEPVDVLHWPLYKTVRLIRGEKGTKVVLTVIPAADISGSVTVTIDLIRDEVRLEDQAATGRVDVVVGPDGTTNRIGVIRLPAFYSDMRNRLNGRGKEFRSSTRDVARILADMKSAGVQGVLLDLRNNGGGSLAEAVEMTGLFIPAGPIVQVRERSHVQVLSDPDPGVLYAGPLVVLVNRASASASEILAGALQDYGRAVIVGDSKTHGKGTVQSLQRLDERNEKLGSLKVTTHTFHRIVGASTQLKGIVPDVVVPSVLDAMEIGEEFLPNPMPWTVVNAAGYRRVDDLEPLLPKLRQRSEERQATDPGLVAHRKLLEQIRDRQRTTEISLNLEERLKLAQAEKALEEAQNAALEFSNDDLPSRRPGAERTPDPVLEEAKRILVDLLGLLRQEEKHETAFLEDARRGQ